MRPGGNLPGPEGEKRPQQAEEPPEVLELGPHPGPQEGFASSSADLVIYGGQAGGGKTFGLLMEAGLRHTENPDFGAVIFRRTFSQILAEGGLWDSSMELYPLLGANPFKSPTPEWRFPSGSRVSFHHLQHEKDRLTWKGAQIPLICFDQLEEFTDRQFWYLVSRNRSTCGVRPYIRATVNPVPPEDEVGGWLHELIGWWIGKDGLPIPERDGVVRWMLRIRDELQWFSSYEEAQKVVVENWGHLPPEERPDPMSITFIAAKLEDNPTLMRRDPTYLTKLEMLPLVERERLRGGNWLVRETAGKLLNRAWFKKMKARPRGEGWRWIRYWDKAATAGGGAASAGSLVGRNEETGQIVIADVTSGHWSALQRNVVIEQVADADGLQVEIVVEQEPGSGGKESAEISIRELAHRTVHADRVTGDKIARSGPFRAQVEAGNVYLVEGEWNEQFLQRAHRFSKDNKDLKDEVDCTVGAYNWGLGIYDKPKKRKVRFR